MDRQAEWWAQVETEIGDPVPDCRKDEVWGKFKEALKSLFVNFAVEELSSYKRAEPRGSRRGLQYPACFHQRQRAYGFVSWETEIPRAYALLTGGSCPPKPTWNELLQSYMAGHQDETDLSPGALALRVTRGQDDIDDLAPLYPSPDWDDDADELTHCGSSMSKDDDVSLAVLTAVKGVLAGKRTRKPFWRVFDFHVRRYFGTHSIPYPQPQLLETPPH